MEHDAGLIARHDARFVRIEKDMNEVRERVITLEGRMPHVEEGVANFRDFQRKTLNHQMYMKGAIAVIAGTFLVMSWVVDHAIDRILPAAKILIEYYDQTHPDLRDKLPKISGTGVHLPQTDPPQDSVVEPH